MGSFSSDDILKLLKNHNIKGKMGSVLKVIHRKGLEKAFLNAFTVLEDRKVFEKKITCLFMCI